MKTKNKFKIGDKVIITDEEHCGFGKECEVIKIKKHRHDATVTLYDLACLENDIDGYFCRAEAMTKIVRIKNISQLTIGDSYLCTKSTPTSAVPYVVKYVKHKELRIPTNGDITGGNVYGNPYMFTDGSGMFGLDLDEVKKYIHII